MTFLGDKWKVLIIRDLLNGTKRFCELNRSIGKISQKVLSTNLKIMEENGLLTRKVFPEVPPRVEYTLTEMGYSLAPVVRALKDWGAKASLPARVRSSDEFSAYLSLSPIED